MWKNIYSCYLMNCLVQRIKSRHRNFHLNLQIICLSRRYLTDFLNLKDQIIRRLTYFLKQLNFRAFFSTQCFWEGNHASLLGTPLQARINQIHSLLVRYVMFVVSLPRVQLSCLILHLGNTYVTLATCCNCRNTNVRLAS